MPDRIHESFFERGHEDAIRDPIGGIGGLFTIRDHLKLLHDRAGFEEKFAHPLEEEDGAVGGLGHRFAPASSMLVSRFLPRPMARTLSCSLSHAGVRDSGDVAPFPSSSDAGPAERAPLVPMGEAP